MAPKGRNMLGHVNNWIICNNRLYIGWLVMSRSHETTHSNEASNEKWAEHLLSNNLLVLVHFRGGRKRLDDVSQLE
jgi:hypothetical protein